MKIKGFRSWKFFNERLSVQLYFPSLTLQKQEQYFKIPMVIRIYRWETDFEFGIAFIFGIGIRWDESSFVESKNNEATQAGRRRGI